MSNDCPQPLANALLSADDSWWRCEGLLRLGDSICEVTHATNKDWRDKPVEEIDFQKARERVVEFLKQQPKQ